MTDVLPPIQMKDSNKLRIEEKFVQELEMCEEKERMRERTSAHFTREIFNIYLITIECVVC